MSDDKKYYIAELRSIDAWREPEGGWSWNDSHLIEDGLVFGEDALTSRSILSALRKWGYLTHTSKGRVRVEHEWPIIEIQNRHTREPLLALLFDERGR